MTKRTSSAITSVLALALLSVPANAAAPRAPAAPAASQADLAFASMKALVGTWRNAENPASPLRIHVTLTAGGTVLVEEWRRGTEPHSLTLYHRDGPALLATHYCPQGNQPRLALAASGNILRFAFRDATDLDPRTESHQHELAFDLTNPARPIRTETYRSAKGDEPSRLVLAREKAR